MGNAIALATLLKITIPDSAGVVLRYQNYQPTSFNWEGESYEPLGFEVQSYPQYDLSIGSEDLRIAIRNTAIIRNLLRQYNDLKRSIVVLTHVQPGLSVPPIGYRTIVSFASYENGLILFTLRSPTSALQGRLVLKFLEAVDFPELPYYRPQL